MILKNRSKVYTFTLLLLAAILSLLLSYSWPLLVFSIIILVFFLPLPKKMGENISIRILISLMLVISLIQIEGLVAYLLKIQMSVFVYNFSTATIVATLALFFSGRQKFKFVADDFWIIFAPIFIVGALVCSMLSLTDKTDINSAIIYKTTTSTDESQHLHMFAEFVNNDSNMTVSPKVYPTGWHLAMSVVVQSFAKLYDMPFMNTLVAYYVTKIFSVFIVTMSTMVLFVVAAKKRLDKRSSYYLLFAIGTAFLSLMVVIPNSEINAFYNFVPQYAYFLLLLSLLICIKESNKKMVYGILIIFAVASFISWILSGLMLMLFTLIAFASQHIERVKINNRTQKIMQRFWQPMALILLGVIAITIAMPNGIVGKSIDLLEHPEGWVEGSSQLTYFILFLLLAKELFFIQKNSLSRQAKSVLITYFIIISGIVLITMLRGYNENLSYYWQKIEFPLLLMSIPLVIILLINKIQKLSGNIFAPYTIILILLTLSIPHILGERTFNLALRSIGNQEYLHKTKDLGITKPLKTLFEDNTFKSSTTDRYIFATSSNYTLDQMVYQLMSESISSARALAATGECFPSIVPNGGYVGSNAALLKSIPKEYCGHKVKVIVSNNTIDDTVKYINPKQLINIDDNYSIIRY